MALLHKERTVVKPWVQRNFRLFPGAVGFGDRLSHSGVGRNGSSDPEQNPKEILKGPCLGEGKGGQRSGYQKSKSPCLLIYSLLGRAGFLLRAWQFLNQSKWQHQQDRILSLWDWSLQKRTECLFDVPLSSSPAYSFACRPNSMDSAIFPQQQ